MQEKFKAALQEMNKAIKNPEDFEIEELLQDLQGDLGGEAVTAELFALQEQKAVLMGELQGALQQLDTEGTVGVEGKMRKLVADEAGVLGFYGKGGEVSNISKGQLQIAGMWGESYFLDQSVSHEVKKKYLIQKTHYQLADILDHQIAASEGHQDYNKNSGFDNAYQAIADRYEEGAEVLPGVIAEKMVQSFLTKLTCDYDMPYKLKSVSVYEDVEYKIDFIIEPVITTVEVNQLGVGVAKPEARPDIGIQFTTAKSPITIKHKHAQLDKAKKRIDREEPTLVNDLILITLPIDHVEDVFADWQNTKNNKRIPGGPDELWSDKVKQEIFDGVIGRILPEKQLEGIWDQVVSSAE